MFRISASVIAALSSGYPSFLLLALPSVSTQVIPEGNNLIVELLIIALVVLIFIKIRRLMCKNM
jgi:hypothetical protein